MILMFTHALEIAFINNLAFTPAMARIALMPPQL